MAKKKKIEAEDSVIPQVIKEEQELEEVLSSSERRQYRRKARAQRRAAWLDEYWIIAILFFVFLALMVALTIGKVVKDKIDAKKLEEETDETSTGEEEADIYNIKEQMQKLL